jgi:NTP pyrophosphatase (non-canonical NTP hydrolase)
MSGEASTLAAYLNLPRDQRQATTAVWARGAFGEAEATSVPQRGLRLLEEAIEAFQACGGDEAMAHKLVAFVFARPPGMVGQELGGVAVTVLLLAAAAGLSADEEECREIHRVLSKPLREFTERNANKNAAGFLVELPRKNPCCGNTGTHGEGGREYCSTCGQEIT